jgi:hypothetical protein
MNSFASNLTAADMVARQVISERVADAAHRAEVRSLRAAQRAARRTARRQTRPTAAPRTHGTQTHDLPVWAARFLFPIR